MATQDRGLPSIAEKRSFVREMFTAIAPRYDFLNHLLSLNLDRRWRRQAVDALDWEDHPSGTYLDLCAGTLDLAVELRGRRGFDGCVVGADFAIPMLALGRGKDRRVAAVGADALQLPFADGTFDGCMVAFGIRNLESVDGGLAEMARVVKPGGRVVILEFSLPRRWPIRPLYLGYFRFVLPHVGRLVSKHTSAYGYLPDSVHAFPEPIPARFGARVSGADSSRGADRRAPVSGGAPPVAHVWCHRIVRRRPAGTVTQRRGRRVGKGAGRAKKSAGKREHPQQHAPGRRGTPPPPGPMRHPHKTPTPNRRGR